VSGLHPLEGHDEERAGIVAALRAGQLPSSLLIHGPPGIGKQRLGLWLGQLLLCVRRSGDGPCGACQPCRLAGRLEHPDLHWFFPLPRPKATGGPERLTEALEEARAAELEARRRHPLQPTAPDGMSGIYLAHVHVLLRVAFTRPAMGSHKVFLIGDAEALVSQEASPEAANALLKLLEEPPPDTTVVLTASEPDVLLPTIRSRLLPFRLRPLAEGRTARFLIDHAGTAPEEAQRAGRLAQGSIGRALGFLPQNGEPGVLDQLRLAARAWLECALERGGAGRFAIPLGSNPAGARGAFADTLEFLTVWLRDLGAASAGAPELIINVDAVDWLRTQAGRHTSALAAFPAAIRDVDATIRLTQFNINPQLALAVLLRKLHGHLGS
jgi:DNA polymerase III subunit delta'